MKTKIYLLLILLQPFISFAQITHSVAFKNVNITDSKTNKDYLEIDCEGLMGKGEQEGFPSLPSKSIFLSIPLGSEIESVKIVNPVIKTISLAKKILPFQGAIPTKAMPEKEFILPHNTIYNSNTHYPQEQVRISHISYFDYTNQIACLEVMPFQYDAKNNRLMFYSSFDIQVTIKEKTIKNNLPEFKRNRSAENQQMYDKILKSLVDNPDDIVFNKDMRDTESKLSRTKSNAPSIVAPELSYEYVVITSAALAPSFQPFVSWKRRKGINIGIVTMEYIRANYSGDTISGIYDDAGKVR